MDFETILAKCGNGNRYQVLLLGLYSYLLIFSSVHNFSQNVISFVPNHWCYHEQLENLSFAQIADIYKKYEKQSCTKLATVDLIGGNTTISEDRCDRWIYDYDFGYRSMNTELNWVCDDAYKTPVGQSFFFVGSMFGTVFFGLLGDRIGRVKAIILANWCGFLGDFSTIFADNLVTFSFTRFVAGLAVDANSCLMYILVVEYVSTKFRSVGLPICIGVSYGIGIISSSWIAVYLGNWRYFLAYSSTPLLLVTFFYFFVQESAQWLITRNDIDGAIKRLQHVAKMNRRRLSESDIDAFRNHCLKVQDETKEDDLKISDMFKAPQFRKTLIKALSMEMMVYLCFNTLARNVEGLGVSPFITFSMFALAMPVAALVRAFIQHRYNRKTAAVSAMIFTGLTAAGSAIIMSVWDSTPAILVVLSVIGRSGMSVSFGCSLLLFTELTPTCVRSRGIAIALFAGAFASLFSPYIIYLKTYYRAAPSIIVCILFFLASYVILLLPETKNRKLPITLADGEKFGKGERMLDFLRKNSLKEPRDENELKQIEKLIS